LSFGAKEGAGGMPDLAYPLRYEDWCLFGQSDARETWRSKREKSTAFTTNPTAIPGLLPL